MLVRVLIVRNSGKADPLANITINQEMMETVNKYGELGERSMYNFSIEVGTHYVSSPNIKTRQFRPVELSKNFKHLNFIESRSTLTLRVMQYIK